MRSSTSSGWRRSARPTTARRPADACCARCARHLAVRMSYEDVIRVAQAKIAPARFARIAAEMGVKPGEPFTVTEFLKPGIEEMCSILPPGLAKRILAVAERRRLTRSRALGHGGQQRVDLGLPAVLAAGQAPPLAPEDLPVRAGAARDRDLAGADRGGCAPVGRAGARSRRMRAPDQGLRRHPQARQRQLPPDRDARHPAGAGRGASRCGAASTRSPARARRRSPTPTAMRSGAAWPSSTGRIRCASRPNEHLRRASRP